MRDICLEERDVGSILSSVVLCFHFICAVIGETGVSYILVFVCLFLYFLVLRTNEYILPKVFFWFVLFVLSGFLISFIRNPGQTFIFVYLKYFLGFGCVPFLAGTVKVDIVKVIKGAIVIAFVGLPIIYIRGYDSLENGNLMGLAYAIMPVMLLCILGMTKKSFVGLASSFVVVATIPIILSIATRGMWLCLIVTMIFGLYYFSNHKKGKIISEFKILLFVVVFILIIIIISINLNEIVKGLISFFKDKLHVSIYALWKIEYYLEKGDIFNGRVDLWKEALGYFFDNPVFGKGIGCFENSHDGGHAHNIFLQAACEFGLVYLLPIVLTFLYSINYLLVKTDVYSDKYGYFLISFITGMVVLLFSSVYWIYVPFWYYIGFLFNDDMMKREKKDEIYY